MPPILFYVVTRVLNLGLTGIWWGIFGITWSAAAVSILYARSQVDRMARSADDADNQETSVA